MLPAEPTDTGAPNGAGGRPQEDRQMSLDVASIGPLDPSTAPDVEPRAGRARAQRDAATVSTGAIPDRPPAEVLDAISAAADRYAELAAQGRELRFDADGSGGVQISLLDGDGTVLRALSGSEALDVATGRDVE
jgi:hypothetical protein